MDASILAGRPPIKRRPCQVIQACPIIRIRPSHGDRRVAWLLLLLSALLFFSRLPCGLLEPQEARYAEISRQMLFEGRLLTPVWHGEDYLHKPPLLYWLIMLSYAVFGVHDWAARLVPCLAGVATVMITFYWARAFLGRRAGLAAAFVLLLSGMFLYLQGMVLFDGLLSLWVVLGWALGHVALGRARFSRACWLGSAMACALGILTKGPVAGVLIAAPLIYVWWKRRSRLPATGALLLTYAATVCVLAAPWFVYLASNNPEEFADFFLLHHVQRFADPLDHEKPWWFFLPIVKVGMLPWTLWAPQALRSVRTRVFWLAGLWCLLFFSLCACKRPAYIVPAFAPLAIALGFPMARCRRLFRAPRPGRYLTGTGRVLVSAGFGGLLAASLLWLPGYHAQFGMREALAPVRHMPETPLFCYPRHWDSVSFYAGGAHAFDAETAEDLFTELKKEERAWLIVRRRDGYQDLKARWPADLEWHGQCMRHPNVVVALIVKR